MYSGTFDGQGHTVSNFTATCSTAGLFGACNNAVIKNLGVMNATLQGQFTGAVAANGANVYRCWAKGCTLTAVHDSEVLSGAVAGHQCYDVKKCFAYPTQKQKIDQITKKAQGRWHYATALVSSKLGNHLFRIEYVLQIKC